MQRGWRPFGIRMAPLSLFTPSLSLSDVAKGSIARQQYAANSLPRLLFVFLLIHICVHSPSIYVYISIYIYIYVKIYVYTHIDYVSSIQKYTYIYIHIYAHTYIVV